MPAGPRARGRGDPVAVALFGVLAVVYAWLGAVLVLRYNLAATDSFSRTANAGFVLASNDPHLGAIGFVWNPLPSLAQLPFVPLASHWPELLSYGVAGAIQCGLFMAGAVVQVRGIALDAGIAAWTRRLLVAGFAVNPMIVTFGGNGMSEASFVFCALWATRRLLRWVDGRATQDLTVAGIALGLGYLSRYEALAAAGAAIAVVVLLSAWSEAGSLRRATRGQPLAVGLHDGFLVAFPVLVSFGVWAGASWLLTGEPLAQFTSQYGNSAQVALQPGASTSASGNVDVILRAVLGHEPLLPLVLVVALGLALLRRRREVLVPVAVFGGILAFEAFAQYVGATFGWFRFYLTAVPLTTVLLVSISRPPTPGTPTLREALRLTRPIPTERRRLRLPAALAAFALAAVSVGLSVPTTYRSMLRTSLGTELQQYGLRYILTADREDADTEPGFGVFLDARAIARLLDEQRLPKATVLVDTFFGFPIWLASERRSQFVIGSDYDFLNAVNRPADFGIRYVLVPNPAEALARLDQVNRRHPTFFADGAGIGRLVRRVVTGGGRESWRIYEVIDPDRPDAGTGIDPGVLEVPDRRPLGDEDPGQFVGGSDILAP